MNVPMDHIESVLFELVTLSLSQQCSYSHTWQAGALTHSGSSTWLCTSAFHTMAQWSSKVPGSLVTVDLGNLDNN